MAKEYKVYRRMLFHGERGFGAASIPMEELTPPPPDRTGAEYRALWKRFYDTIAIEGRLNPRCRMSHMPRRYWENMTEFTETPETPETLPGGAARGALPGGGA